MQGKIPAIAALAVGGLFLSNWMKRTQLPHVEFTHEPGQPLVSRRETVVVRTPASGTLLGVAALVGGLLAWTQMRKAYGLGTSSVEEVIELNVPLSTAYNQWTQFEDFPKFMDSVEEVKQLDDTHLHWRANVAGKPKEWDAEIIEQVPDKRIAWRSIGGVQNAGKVDFQRIGPNRTKVRLQMHYDPETVTEKIGDAVGAVKLTAKGNLRRFKDLVERRGVETGAWRGTVAPH